jgi:CRP/FNR family cyclic AMP-dependent transcriptional regulator
MERNKKLWYLENSNILKALNPEEKRELAKLSIVFHAAKNEAVFLSGQASNLVFILKVGTVKISKFCDDGREVIFSLIRPGDGFGDLALAGEENRDTAAYTLEPSFICALPHDRFLNIMNRNPAFCLQITKLIGFRLLKAESRLTPMLFKTASERIRALIWELADEHGRKIGAEVEVKKHFFVRPPQNPYPKLRGPVSRGKSRRQ